MDGSCSRGEVRLHVSEFVTVHSGGKPHTVPLLWPAHHLSIFVVLCVEPEKSPVLVQALLERDSSLAQIVEWKEILKHIATRTLKFKCVNRPCFFHLARSTSSRCVRMALCGLYSIDILPSFSFTTR